LGAARETRVIVLSCVVGGGGGGGAGDPPCSFVGKPCTTGSRGLRHLAGAGRGACPANDPPLSEGERAEIKVAVTGFALQETPWRPGRRPSGFWPPPAICAVRIFSSGGDLDDSRGANSRLPPPGRVHDELTLSAWPPVPVAFSSRRYGGRPRVRPSRAAHSEGTFNRRIHGCVFTLSGVRVLGRNDRDGCRWTSAGRPWRVVVRRWGYNRPWSATVRQGFALCRTRPTPRRWRASPEDDLPRSAPRTRSSRALSGHDQRLPDRVPSRLRPSTNAIIHTAVSVEWTACGKP